MLREALTCLTQPVSSEHLLQSVAERGEIFDFVVMKPQKVMKIVAWWVKRGYCGWKWGLRALESPHRYGRLGY